MPKDRFNVSDIPSLAPVCARLATLSAQHRIITFSGEMGAGKTTLIKEFCNHLGVKDDISSPTFSLVNEYASPNGPIYHFDLYRIRSEEEMYDIGYEDYFDSGYLCLVEWPEMAPGIIPDSRMAVRIETEADARTITINLPQ